jgi:hypothetical protein
VADVRHIHVLTGDAVVIGHEEVAQRLRGEHNGHVYYPSLLQVLQKVRVL